MAEAPAAKSGPNDNDKEDKTKTEMSETATHADAKHVKKAQKNDETDSSPARKIAKDKQMTRARVKLEDIKIETNTMDDDNATEISRNAEDSEAKNAVKTEANDPGVFEADMEQTTQVNEDSKATSKAASNLLKGFANDTDAKVDEEAQLPVKPETIERKVHVKTETNGSETNLDAENNDTDDTGTNARVEGDEAMEAVTKGLTKSPAEKCAGNQQVAQVNVKSETKEAKIDVKAIGNVDGAQVLVKPEAVKREDTPLDELSFSNGELVKTVST
ncbi:Hypothetical Protein FCC1311_106802 [Hondaea fermentalgiana]|uniref:Uncharacterized protein n=1 Tax=Hondaea fermentalgiana TaxID=2315210 RepID=A0A2R5GUA9_9STRA|nr:Hypothetical Protein FCC1311_106802 [Hondaea fermentalgiana]|eukprot:GBG34456.1 Hypothetical Protein FCC1311_106802 [Hondaea fermentalgiana]